MLTWAIAWVIVSGAGGWPLLFAGIVSDITLALIATAAVSAVIRGRSNDVRTGRAG